MGELRTYKGDLVRAYDADVDRRRAMTPAKWRTDITDTFAADALANGIGSVLELGCGTGQLASRLTNHGLDVTAIDLSPANVTATRELGVNALVADFVSLPFPDNTFEAGFAMNSLLHVPSDEFPTVLAEIARVLQSGSPLLIVVWGGTDQEGPIDDEWLEPKRFFRFYTDEGLLALDTPGFRLSAFDTADVSEGDHTLRSQFLTLETL